MNKISEGIVILGFSVYSIYLIIIDDINLYIHPRFVSFSLVTAIIAAIYGLIIIFLNRKSFTIKAYVPKFYISALIFVIVVGFGFPAMPLSAVTAEKRIDNLNNTNLYLEPNSYDPRLNKLLDKEDKDINDWVYIVINYQNKEYFKNQKVNLNGFVLPDKNYSSGFFYITKFTITCCAVDATPVGLSVRYDWMDEFAVNDWVELEGDIELRFRDEENKLNPYVIIYPDTIRKIDPPEDPYLF